MDQSLASGSGARAKRHGQQLCLLSLDGGGVRGLSSLLIIKKLMESINPDDPPKPCDYFDMIGGTSTGGLIAIMLGRLHMTVDECITEYKKLSPDIFTKIHHRVSWHGRLRGRFDDNALKEGVRSLLKGREIDPEELFKEDSSQPGCRTFVCATSEQTSETVVLSSYYSDRRGNDLRKVAKIWEVARATSAAASFFDGIAIGGEGFKDGGTGANNPINELWTEVADIFADSDEPDWRLEDNLKCLVSIGTGQLLLTAFGTSVIKNEVGEALVAITTNCEKTADTFHKHHSNLFQDCRAFRLNVEQGLEKVGLEEASKFPEIESATRRYIQTEATRLALKSCASNLKDRVWFEEIIELLRRRCEHLVSSVEDEVDASSSITHTSAHENWICNGGALHYLKTSRLLNQPEKKEELEPVALNAGKVLRETHSLEPVILYLRCTPLRQRPVLDPTTLEAGILQSRDYDPSSATKLADVLRSLTTRYLWAIASNLSQAALLETIRFVCDETNITPPRLGNLLVSRSSNSVSAIFHTLVQKSKLPIVIAIDNADAIEYDDIHPFLSRMIEHSMLGHVRFAFSSTHLNVSLLPEPLSSNIRVVTVSTEYSECLRCIVVDGQHVRLEEIGMPEPGTTEWIWSHQAYLSWEQCSSGILWIQGKPGSGKSVLAKSILEQGRLNQSNTHPQGSQENNDSSVLICDWFYSTRSSEELMSHTSFMQSILYQMIKQRPHLFTHFARIYRQFPALSKDWVTLSSLMEVLTSIVVSGIVGVCVVDAMDESEDKAQADQRRSTVLRYFSTLVSDIPESRMKFLVLSRPYPDIEQQFTRMRDYKHNVQTIILEHENSAAIEKIVTSGMKSLYKAMHPLDISDEDGPTLSSSDGPKKRSHKQRKRKKRSQISLENIETVENEKIRSYLIKNADGVILWVTLMIDSLKADIETGLFTYPQLHKRLEGLPKDLNNLYRRILDELIAKLDEEHRLISRRALMWVSGANAIQPLTISQLHEALAVPKLPEDIETALRCQTDPIQRNKTPISDDWSHFRYQLRKMCGPLIEVIKPTSKQTQIQHEGGDEVDRSDLVQLLHRTVKDFLANHEAAGDFSFSEDLATEEVYETARAYATLTIPTAPVPYAPWWLHKGTGLSNRTRKLAEYLDNRTLMPFFLSASDKNSRLGWFNRVVPKSLYHAFSIVHKDLNHDFSTSQDNAKTGTSKLESHVNDFEYLEEVVKMCIYHSCTEGLLTAMEIVLYLLPKLRVKARSNEGLLKNLTHVVLLAAIESEQPDAVTSLVVMSRPDLNNSPTRRTTPHHFWDGFPQDPELILFNILEFSATIENGNIEFVEFVYDNPSKIVRQPELCAIDRQNFNFTRNQPTNEEFNLQGSSQAWPRPTEAKVDVLEMVREWMVDSGQSDIEDTDCKTAMKMVLDHIKQRIPGFDELVRITSGGGRVSLRLLPKGVQLEYGFSKNSKG